ncbi:MULTISPECIES: serine hydrolase [unclassified Streptomyces]|uniref:serine hydrolase n=1 Tax=unclassified Streptomyces TaxID=2593676 RepID=UPI0028C41A58|nr:MULTISPECIES: serine hydrolase [unclassified Streptomyces]WNO75598.1 serine hydrolase [Streptomyces sp. AM8-1-1]
MSPRHAARTRRPVVLAAVTVAAVMGGCVAAGAYSLGRTPDAVPSAAVSSPSPAASPQGAVRTAEAAVDLDASLARALEPVALRSGASLSVAVLDTASGDTAVHGREAYDTASIVKVGILAALLLRAQDDGRTPTAEERTRAAAMIRLSDNDAATALFTAVGGAAGLDAAHARLGLTETAAEAAWGLTRTTARDQLALLRAVFGTDSVLNEDSRSLVRALMADIAADQDWGVSAAGTGWALKNGWMPRTATGLWDVNSIGRVSVGGRVLLIAVLSAGHATKEAGIAVVEAAARAAVGALS